MYLNIGQDTVVMEEDILGIFDLDNTTVMKSTREYINTAAKKGECITVSFEELPKSFVVTTKNNERKVYVSPFNTSTIYKKIKANI